MDWPHKAQSKAYFPPKGIQTNLLLNFSTTRLLNLLVLWPELDPTFLVAEVVSVACSVGGRPAQSIHIPYCVWQAYCSSVVVPKISTIIF